MVARGIAKTWRQNAGTCAISANLTTKCVRRPIGCDLEATIKKTRQLPALQLCQKIVLIAHLLIPTYLLLLTHLLLITHNFQPI